MAVRNRKCQIIAIVVVVLAYLLYVTRNYWSSVSIIGLCILLCTVLLFRCYNLRFNKRWSSIANQLGVRFLSPGSKFQKLLGIEFLLAKECLLLGGLYRNHTLSLTTYLEIGGRRQRGGSYFRLQLGIAHPNIEKMSISPNDIQMNHDHSESKSPFEKKYFVSGDEEDKVMRIIDNNIQTKIMNIEDFSMRTHKHGAYIEAPINHFGFDVTKFNSQIDIAIDIIERIEGLGTKDPQPYPSVNMPS
ncbi:hypothetical protein ACFLVP_02240 [Chloroflexota bacterium]